jgi:hypothetical protein
MTIHTDEIHRSFKVSKYTLVWALAILAVSPLCGYIAYWFHPNRDVEGFMQGGEWEAIWIGVGVTAVLCLTAWLLGLASLIFGVIAVKKRRIALLWVIPLAILLPLTLIIAIGNIGR